jgi:tRNA-specific 2-thiouridylase
MHWITGMPPVLPTICRAKVRYRQNDQSCVISMIGPNFSRIVFDEPQWAVTPGQSIVFYNDDVCIGGGVIRSAQD